MTIESRVIDHLAELMALPAPTGQEEPVLRWCREQWSSLGAVIVVTPVGNVLAHLSGTGPRLLIQGHADEIGFVVRGIDERGFIWLADGQAGSRKFQGRYPVGHPALIITGPKRIRGIFATPTGHILSTRSVEPSGLDASELFVDIGAESKQEALDAGVEIGAGVVWNPPVERLGNRIVGKAIDDRVALAIMTTVLERLGENGCAYDLTIAATVQEEIGLVGATSLHYSGPFDLAIAIDNAPVADYPGVDPLEISAKLGGGPMLVVKDSWTHYDRRIIDQLQSVAEQIDIPVQRVVLPGIGTDGGALIRAGVPSALLAIATRYTHSAFEMADVRDINFAVELTLAYLRTPAEVLPLGPS